ncbi:acyl-CoA N-acyltransferase [Pseudomassariella vexata]|uniref:histone acetyltransferase n=1 Tax=Pseudomassariella vexata TaxID=1141098 RepID=A0A1Y2DHJ7_9PEZI|nr:acyl-CoA N-acyltransferase [Pseudomassariella vexata]ORY58721.1 acyl-CoA N-acyltransferase [Pseudomassariella vexata]
MAPTKRKRPHDEAPAAQSKSPTEPPPRRTTRHVAVIEGKQLRSGKLRANSLEALPTIYPTYKATRARNVDAPKSKAAAPPPPTAKTTRSTRAQAADVLIPVVNGTNEKGKPKEKEKSRPLVERPKSRAVAAPKEPPSTVAQPIPEPKPETQAPQAQTPQTTNRTTNTRPRHSSRAQAPASSLTDPAAVSAVTPKRRISTSKSKKPPSTPRSDRNIDKVVLGNICFRAWYPSYYDNRVLGDVSGNAGGKDNGGGATKIGGGKKDKEVLLDRLYVCPCCFKYSRELVSWSEHVRLCESKAEIPGKKIYIHPKGKRKVKVSAAAPAVVENAKGKGRKKEMPAPVVEEVVVSDEGEWSVWELDGEVDGLFCQNLSLFAKLFLDNKSVFFDVTGFNYFLLVYTPPPPPSPQATQSRNDSPSSDPAKLPSSISAPPRPQIIGFFSKEKMSWDNNNLACILVFPPWQRKGLGSLLMGVSYEISRRERVLGGPEKPISDLGRKGYKRFWAGEIARWLLSVELPVPAEEEEQRETIVDIEEISQATWIAPEDCLAVLREMSIVEEAGVGLPKGAITEEAVEEEGKEKDKEKEVKEVPRVRVDKDAIRRWVGTNKISLEKTCDPDGFVEGYAVKEVEVGEEE